MSTDGGGWTLVLLNSNYPSHPTPTFYQAVNENNITGTLGNLNGGFDQWLGVKYWMTMGTKLRLEQGANSGSLVYRVDLDFTLNPNDSYRIFVGNPQLIIGSTLPGLIGHNNNRRLSTFGTDNDDLPAKCTDQYSNAPWWYGLCWNGSFWGGGFNQTFGHENKPYWAFSHDFFDWGAIWIR